MACHTGRYCDIINIEFTGYHISLEAVSAQPVLVIIFVIDAAVSDLESE